MKRLVQKQNRVNEQQNRTVRIMALALKEIADVDDENNRLRAKMALIESEVDLKQLQELYTRKKNESYSNSVVQ
jgi:hypothetical protein